MICTLRPPKADKATISGIIHETAPINLSPNVTAIASDASIAVGLKTAK